MKLRDYFELGFRLLGVYTLLWGIGYLTESAIVYTEYTRSPDLDFRYYLIYGWVNIFVGLFLVRAPWLLINFAFPEEGPGEDENEKAQTTEPK